MQYLKRLVALAMALGVGVWSLVFSLSNQQQVALNLVFFELSSQRVSLWIVGAFVLGGIVGMLSASGALFRAWRLQSVMARELRHHAEADLQKGKPDGLR